MSTETLKNFIGGEWVAASTSTTLDVKNPATGQVVSKVPLSGQADLDKAVAAAEKAFPSWRQTPPAQRARYLFTFRQLLEENFEEIARTVTLEHGKTLAESRGDIRRGIENVEHACGIPTLMMGDSVEDVGPGIDCASWHQPLGVFGAVTPFNFPAMVPMWFWPYAVATGNTFVFKPSEQVPMTQDLIIKLADKAGFPAGVINMVHGDKDISAGIVEHPGIAGVSFVGSTPIAELVYKNAAALGKRVQALGGAKNHVIVMPDAAFEPTVATVSDSCYGCSGQRCLAGATVVTVGDVHDNFVEAMANNVKNIKMGDGLDENVKLGPVISAPAYDRIMAMINKAEAQGAKIVVDGRNAKVQGYEEGYWIGATLITGVTEEMEIAHEEVFGPVMVIKQAKDLDEAIDLIHASRYANATSIFTTSGKAARDFRYKAGVSMMGINIGVAAPMAYFPFGGTKKSFFGDTKAHGKDSIRFFTDPKVAISRWF